MFGTYVQRIPVKGQQRYFVSQGKYRIRDLRESFKLLRVAVQSKASSRP